MEESEKRRERLRAMRTVASQAGASSEIDSGFHQLSNPLIESTVTPMQTNAHGATRFDYYTDPMAAFSNDRRMSKGSYQSSPGSFNRVPTPRNPEMTPSPAHQVRPTYSPEPRMYQPRSTHYSSEPMHPEMTPSPAHRIRPTYSPDPRMYQPRSTHYSSEPMRPEMTPWPAHHIRPTYSPDPRMHRPQSLYCQQPQSPFYSSGPGNAPAYQGQSVNFEALGPYHNPNHHGSPRGAHGTYGVANFRSPSFRGTLSSSSARSPNTGSGYGSSPSPGRGRGRSGFGRGGNRGVGSHGSISAELRPDLYYSKSMVEDPWKNLAASIWKVEDVSVKGFNVQDSRKSSHSDSFGTKKPRILEASKESSSQPSLAEYLAAAFNETVGEEGNGDKSIL